MTTAPRATSVFRACVVNAVRDGEGVISRLVEGTRQVLLEQEEKTREMERRNLIGDALRLLKEHEAALTKAYPMALLEIFAQGADAPAPKMSPAKASGMDFGELSLVDDEEVLAQMELARAQQLAMHATDAALAELNTLVSTAQGLPSVQPEANPMRPENYIRALQQVVGEVDLPAPVRQLWMLHMGELLGPRLVESYQRAATSLREHGIKPASYTVLGMAPRAPGWGGAYPAGLPAGGPAPGHGAGTAPVYMQGQAPGYFGAPMGAMAAGVPLSPLAEEALLTAGMLRQMLQAGGDPFAWDALPGAQAGGMATPVMGVPSHALRAAGYLPAAAVEAMEGVAQLEQLVDRLSGTAALAGAQASRGAPLSATRTAHDLLARMMENIAQDERLLPSMQRAVLNFEPALKQLVRHDSGFFSDAAHPARQLLDDITQRALLFRDEHRPAFVQFLHQIDQSVAHLAKVELRDAAPFARVLKVLRRAWTEQEARQQQKLNQRLSQKIAADIRQLPDTDKVGHRWMDFLTGPWADVVALAQDAASDTQSDPGGYLALVPVLLACAQPDTPADESERPRSELAAMLPVVRRGLRSLDWSDSRIAELLEQFTALSQAHQDAARQSVQPPLQAGAPPEPDAQTEIQTIRLGAGAPTTSAGVPLDTQGAPLTALLQLGQWVELAANRHQTVRTRLTWCSPHQTLFLFTAPDGSTQSMTRRMIERQMAQGQFRPLESREGEEAK